MGGGAFAQASAQGEPTLATPRLQPDQYAKLKAIYLKKLQVYFPGAKIACLTEAPEKVDYGDIDIFVAIETRANWVDMANFLGAAGVICHTSGRIQKCTLGVPIDGSAHTRPAVVYKHINDSSSRKLQPSSVVTVDDYAQIDIEVLAPDLLEWHRFYSSYGDMVGLLGHIVQNLGFTVSDLGLWLRLLELDVSKTVSYVNIADKDCRIFLSKDPILVMQFLGLSVQSYDEGFNTLDALYEWLGQCRLLSAYTIKIKRNNAHERNREAKRTVFSGFFQEWLPTHLHTDEELVDTSTSEEDKAARQTEIVRKLRSTYLDEAVDFFNRRAEYEKLHSTITLTFENATAAELLKPIIAQHSEKEGKNLNEIVRALRRYVGIEADGQPYILDQPHSDAQSQLHRFLADDRQSLRDPTEMTVWVGENWEELRGLERQRIKAIVGGDE
jgi:hypothetical protein